MYPKVSILPYRVESGLFSLASAAFPDNLLQGNCRSRTPHYPIAIPGSRSSNLFGVKSRRACVIRLFTCEWLQNAWQSDGKKLNRRGSRRIECIKRKPKWHVLGWNFLEWEGSSRGRPSIYHFIKYDPAPGRSGLSVSLLRIVSRPWRWRRWWRRRLGCPGRCVSLISG